jgi:transcriptional regulator with XRE-family HTH domain
VGDAAHPFLVSISDKRLKDLRLLSGLTQAEFAEVTGFTLKVYQHIEAGRRSNLQLKTLDRIAWAYGLNVHSLFAPELPDAKLAQKPTPRIYRRA